MKVRAKRIVIHVFAWALAIGRTDADLLELLTDAPARQAKAPVAAVAHAAA